MNLKVFEMTVSTDFVNGASEKGYECLSHVASLPLLCANARGALDRTLPN